ncbi:MAG: LacI family transcriptional regulator [Lactobacillaceae bacterium]|jgi:LacI family transcriptional regulator|nr:LacI family transcriptional regulator [Lactobacillaceae bacterium]
MSKITIKDIARESGFSIATVSYVINGVPNKAKESTKRKIEAVIAKYNYSPDMNARSMVNVSSNLLGILYYSPKSEVNFSDPFLSDLLTGIEVKVKGSNKFILVHGFSEIDDIKAIQNNWKFDGFVVIGAVSSIHDQIDRFLQGPVVFIDTYFNRAKETAKAKYPRIYVNNHDSNLAYLATQRLLAAGHTKIAFFSPHIGLNENGVVYHRIKGIKKALAEEDLAFDDEIFFDETEVQQLVDQHSEYTAVLANSDLLAMTAIKELKIRNILGKSIISFDNSFFATGLEPALTTVELNQKEKGEAAIQALIDAEHVKQVPTKRIITISGKLIERDSVKGANNDGKTWM